MATTFTAPRLELVNALADAAVGAGTDRTLPMLCAVFLSGDKGAESVTLTATDRFIMIQRVVQLEHALEDDIRALIPLEQVKTLVGVLKLSARHPAPLEVTVDEPYLTVDKISVPLEDREFVKFTSILEGALERQGADINLLAVNLGYLTKIGKLSAAKARKGVAHIRFTPAGHRRGDGQPGSLVVDLGDDGATRVLLMPARVDT